MGLDQYIYHIRKPKLADATFTKEEIYNMNLSSVSVEEARSHMSLFADVLPYAIKRNVITEYYDIEKLIADYDLPANSHIGMASSEGIRLGGYDSNGKYVRSPIITDEELKDKYIYAKEVPCYIWQEEEVHYWRKNYDL